MDLFPKVSNLRKQHQMINEKLLPFLKSSSVVHLDIPCHLNIGDLLIDLGTSEFISENNINCIGRYSACEQKFLKADQFPSGTTLLLHGGGNFGDLYKLHQDFRKKILIKYQKNKIIILPQSVHYENKTNFIEDARIFNNHSQLLICARDEASYNFLAKEISTSKLCLLPDMATCLVDTLQHNNHSNNNKLIFRRRDKEKKHNQLTNESDSFFDWDDLITKNEENNMLQCKKIFKKSKWRVLHNLATRKHILLRNQLTEKAIEHFLKYDTIDTDRLHGLILAQLLNKKVIMRDNSYGKLNNYFKTWLKDF